MSYGVYILVVVLTLGGVGLLALTTRPAHHLLRSTVGHPRPSALVGA